MLTDFLNFFTVRLSRKFVIKSYLSTPLHPKRVPVRSDANEWAQVFLFARIFYNITYKLKHLQFQLIGMKIVKNILIKPVFVWTTFKIINRIGIEWCYTTLWNICAQKIAVLKE